MRIDEADLDMEISSKQTEENNHETDQHPKQKGGDHCQLNITNSLFCRMELWVMIFAAIAGLLAIVGSTLGLQYHQRDIALWVGFAAAVFGIASLFCGIQDRFWKKDEADSITTRENAKKTDNLSAWDRAYVVCTDVVCDPLIPEVGKRWQIKGSIKNVGRTPALKCRMTTYYEAVPKGGAPDFIYADADTKNVNTMAPDGLFQFNLFPVISKSVANVELNPAIVEKLHSGNPEIFVYGKVEYEDVIGAKHWMTFCFSMITPITGRFAVYKEHNESDHK